MRVNKKNRIQCAVIRLIIVGLVMLISLPALNYLCAQSFDQISYAVKDINGKEYRNPFAGGINNIQASEIDLNNDGIKDLFIFDRAGDFISCFLNGGKKGEIDYQYAPEYAKMFPVLKDFVLLRDYDGDGLEDIFSSASNTQGAAGVEVYHTSRENGRLKFELRKQEGKDFDILYYRRGSKLFNIQIDAPDYPAVEDIDGDGDLDILTFEPLGGYVYFFRNMVIENGHSLDDFEFELEDECWGKFYESGVDEEISLSTDPDMCYEQIKGPVVKTRHSGSTLLPIDMDGDQDKDIIIGDLTSSNLNLLTNGGSKEKAFMTTQDHTFPSYDRPIEMPIFLTSFNLDLNNDNKKDILAGVNVPRASANYNSTWFYENVSADDNQRFEFRKNNILIDEMIDLGTGVRPVFVDYNADGLMDIIAGNDHYYEEGGKKNSRLFLFLNTGTKTNPSFQLIDDDYLNFSKYSDGTQGTWNFTPCFGDLDNDGDLDLLVGELNGRLFHAENIAGPNATFKFGTISYNYKELNAQRVSVPAIIDIDGDGLNDIVLGTRQATNDEDRKACGNFYFFKNIGTSTDADFNPDQFEGDNTPCFGRVILQDVQLHGGRVYSSPYFYNHDGEFRMYAGTNSGIKVLGNIEGNLDGTFSIIDDLFGDIVDGEHIHVALEDIDNDDILELLVGTYRGGLNLFKTNVLVNGNSVDTKKVDELELVSIAPNPIQNGLLNIYTNGSSGIFTLYEIHGKLIKKGNLHAGANIIQMSNIQAGIYICKIEIGGRIITKKIIYGK